MIAFAAALAILFVLFLGTACTPVLPPTDAVMSASPRPTVEVCIDEDFTDHAAFQAVEAWDTELRGVVTLRATEASYLQLGSCDIGIYRIDSTAPWVALQPSWELAYTSKDLKSIYVIADRRPDLRRLVLEHELGHALGLKHSLTGLMRPAHAHDGARISTTDAIWAAYYLGGAK